MTGNTTTVGIEVRADGTQEAARDLAAVDASLQKIRTGLGGTVQPAGAAAQGLADVGDAGKKAGTGLDVAAQAARKLLKVSVLSPSSPPARSLTKWRQTLAQWASS